MFWHNCERMAETAALPFSMMIAMQPRKVRHLVQPLLQLLFQLLAPAQWPDFSPTFPVEFCEFQQTRSSSTTEAQGLGGLAPIFGRLDGGTAARPAPFQAAVAMATPGMRKSHVSAEASVGLFGEKTPKNSWCREVHRDADGEDKARSQSTC